MKEAIIIILVFINFTIINNLKCGNDKLSFKPPINIKLKGKNNSKRKLDNEFRPMKVKVDYTQVKIDTYNIPDVFEKIKISLDLATHYFELLLSVQRTNFKTLKHNDLKFLCGIDNVDPNCTNWLNEYDLILLPSFTNETETNDVYASAYPCLFDDDDSRPIGGRINILPNFDFNKNNLIIFLQTVLFHEITHILVFHPVLLDSFDAIKAEIVGEEIKYYIASPKVIEKAKIHFGCNSLEKLPLEDQGGQGSAGSHWEGRYMLGDYMVSTNYHENVISDITLALFEDSGWYKVNYYTGGLFRFGKNVGCQFFENDCIINGKAVFPNEFCDKSREPKCLSSHLGTGECYIGDYKNILEIPPKYQYFKKEYLGGLVNVNFCPASNAYFDSDSQKTHYFETNCRYGASLNIFEHYGEVIGNKSLCFESSLVPRYSPQPYKWRSICYKMACDRVKKNIIVFINDLNVTCPYNGGILKKIKGFKGKIKCPDYNLVCTSETWCNEMFECIDKKSVTDYSTYIKENSEDL